jgi:hypothetical protein
VGGSCLCGLALSWVLWGGWRPFAPLFVCPPERSSPLRTRPTSPARSKAAPPPLPQHTRQPPLARCPPVPRARVANASECEVHPIFRSADCVRPSSVASMLATPSAHHAPLAPPPSL